MLSRLAKIFVTLFVTGLVYGQALLTITKTPYEQFNCSMDFVQKTPAITLGNLVLVSVTAATTAGVDATAALIAASPVPAVVPGTLKVAYRVKGGVVGTVYRISVKTTDSSTGELFEGVMFISVTVSGQ